MPTVERPGQQHCTTLARHFSLAKKHRFQRRNTHLLIALNITKLAGKGRLAQRAVQRAGQVVALALEVKPPAFEVHAKHAAPATTTGVGLVHRFQLHGPQRIEVSQAIALKQCPVSFGDKISHSRPSKKRTI